MEMSVQIFTDIYGHGPYRFVQWDRKSLYQMRELVEVFGPGPDWTVEMVSYALTFMKSGVAVTNMAPGDWFQLEEWADSSTPGIISNSSMATSYQKIFN
jgi:hypothetical protein